MSEEQKTSVNRYPVLEPGKDSAWSGHDVVTEDRPIAETDSHGF